MKIYNKINVPNFKVLGNKGVYVCNMCGQTTSLSESISQRGHNLICMRCVNKMSYILGLSIEHGTSSVLELVQHVGREEEKNS